MAAVKIDRRGAQRLDSGLYVHVAQPKEWSQRAACHKMTELFMLPHMRRGRPGKNELSEGRRVNREYETKIAQAKAVCAMCPVFWECREWSLSEPDPAEGMTAGGLTFDEREIVRRQIV